MISGPSPAWTVRVVEVLGPLGSFGPVVAGGYSKELLGGGIWRAVIDDRQVLVKTGRGATDEADGLRRLGDAARVAGGGIGIPAVLMAEDGLIVTEWVRQAIRETHHEDALGVGLASIHAADIPERSWGGGSHHVGACPVDPAPAAEAAQFYAGRLSDLAQRCGLEDAVGPVVARLGSLIPEGGPALLHGDLWWGNVLWGSDGRPWLIDPSIHAGHPEEDLATLALFGAVPARLLAAYLDVHPLPDGWQDRTAMWQLYPLLVHTVLFGGSYRSQVMDTAARYA